jgi:hypothetical protein
MDLTDIFAGPAVIAIPFTSIPHAAAPVFALVLAIIMTFFVRERQQ